MTTTPPPGLLEVGRCGKPHGVRGQITVRLSTNRHERLRPGSRLWIGEWLEVVSSAQVPGSDRFNVAFAGVGDRTAAERLVNAVVYGEPIEDAEAVWLHQVIGARVRDLKGRDLGTCLAVLANPAHDLLELESGVLVPSVFVVQLTGDAQSGFTVLVDPPDGLSELFEVTADRENN